MSIPGGSCQMGTVARQAVSAIVDPLSPIDDSQAVTRAFADAAAAWPDIPLAPAVFVAQLERNRAAFDPRRGAWPHAADLYLAAACAAGAPGAADALESSCLAPLALHLRPILGAGGDLSEIQQILRCRLLVAPAGAEPGIARYGGIGPLRTWVRAGAVREAIRLRQHQRRHVELPVDDLLAGGDLQLDHVRSRYGDEFKRAFQIAFESLSTRERTLLRHAVIDRLRLDDIARLMCAHRVTVSKWLARARSKLLSGTRRQMARQLHLSPLEMSSVMRCVQSGLDVSLERLLA
jgi:RNA polymerase sigma-70 factor (ECF subfamily)